MSEETKNSQECFTKCFEITGSAETDPFINLTLMFCPNELVTGLGVYQPEAVAKPLLTIYAHGDYGIVCFGPCQEIIHLNIYPQPVDPSKGGPQDPILKIRIVLSDDFKSGRATVSFHDGRPPIQDLVVQEVSC